METISFAGDGLGADLIPVDELADCAGTALEEDGDRILSYGTGAGYTPLRELLAEQYGVHPYRVFTTNGWLQGFSLLTDGRIRGKNVVAEYPTYERALHLMFREGASLIYADWHEDGINLELLADTLKTVSDRPALGLLTPTFHNPSGRTLPTEQRRRFGEILYRRSILTVEDDSYGLLRYEGETLPTLFELSDKTIVYSTSFSLTLAPGLRVGVFILPQDLAGPIATKANDTYITPSLLGQATVFEFLRRGNFDDHVEQLREKLKERRDAMFAALEKHLPDETWSKPEGGIFILLSLTPGVNAKALIEQAEGVTALAGEDFGGLPQTIRLNFAMATPEEIELGIERLAAAVNAQAPA
ncbi:MAG TPA: PLP-dependent aminotransferase family protein [Gaiellaceae bacterium]|jgi:DNA-binding transcriptional MocR family regulator